MATTDHEECGTECDLCENRIEAGQPVHTKTFKGGLVTRWCSWCDTNVDAIGQVGRTKTAAHVCPCPPCAAARLLRQLVASVVA